MTATGDELSPLQRGPAPRNSAVTAVERAILDVAGRQHGVVTRAQLLATGLGPSAVSHRLTTGRLESLHRGVYRVGPRVAPRAREMAAVLACGPAAVLSHASGADLLRIVQDRRRPDLVEVTLAGSSRSRPGVRVHRVRALPADEVTRVEGIPVTTAARTIVDLAGVVESRELERAVAEAIALRRATHADILAMAERHRRRPGVPRLRALLGAATDPARTRSRAEEIFLRLVRDARLPPPETNVRIAGHLVDFLWRTQRLVVEIDGFNYHSSPASFEADRIRDATLVEAGFQVTRVTWRRLQNERLAVLAGLVRALDRADRAEMSAARPRCLNEGVESGRKSPPHDPPDPDDRTSSSR